MKTTQHFLELDKKRGAFKLTLGQPFGRLLFWVALLVTFAFLSKDLPREQVASLLKVVAAGKAMP